MNQTFKKPAKWIEVLMLQVLPAICFVAIICFIIYFKTYQYHPGNFNRYEVAEAVDKN